MTCPVKKLRELENKINSLARLWKCAPKDVLPRIQKAVRLLNESEEILDSGAKCFEHLPPEAITKDQYGTIIINMGPQK